MACGPRRGCSVEEERGLGMGAKEMARRVRVVKRSGWMVERQEAS